MSRKGIEDFIRDSFWQEKHQTTPRLTKAKHISVSALDSILFLITNGSLSSRAVSLIVRRSLLRRCLREGCKRISTISDTSVDPSPDTTNTQGGRRVNTPKIPNQNKTPLKPKDPILSCPMPFISPSHSQTPSKKPNQPRLFPRPLAP